jgi:hypothetical protein
MCLRPAAALVAVLAAALACDAGLEPEPICARGLVGLCGTIRFRGAIPDSTADVAVVAYATFPQSCSDLFTFRPLLPPSVPYTDSVAAYSLTLAQGRYEWVVAVWRKTYPPLTFTVADTAVLRAAGHFRDPADTTQPGAVTVTSGPAVGDVNFVVNFDSLRPVSYYFPCSAR